GVAGAWEATDSSGLRPILVLLQLPNRVALVQDLLVQLQGAEPFEPSVVAAALYAHQLVAAGMPLDRSQHQWLHSPQQPHASGKSGGSAAGVTQAQQHAGELTFATAVAHCILRRLASKRGAFMDLSFWSFSGTVLLGLILALLVHELVEEAKAGP
ncbi:hypothetical protein DUNSADRAFT_17086, partial [Dunaliella salina]